ncbi:MAG TPA: TetR family transcriptional regulator [Chthoniobacterales bacterium]
MPRKKFPSFQRARQPDQIKQRQEAILHAALVLFQKNGLENVSLNDIAKKVGTAKSNIYRYFDSREHIYLQVLQRLASKWEARLYPLLDKLKGKGTVEKVAAILADAYIESEEYGELVSVVNPVLEKKLTPTLVVDFRSVFLERRKRLARVLASAIPDMKFERILPLTLHLFVHVPGLWPFCHPTLASKQMLEQPQFAHLNLDFQVEIRAFLQMLLQAALE